MAATTSSTKLEDQAAAAALYAQRDHNRNAKRSSGHPILDDEGRLSSASAATSLKYAKAQDLPSFPSAGLNLSSAGAAASLADSSKKSFEHWKPGSIPAANKAAMLAKDYEMDPLWKPELSKAGSKAALMAHKETPTIEPYRAPETREGQSAAGQALKTKPSVKAPERDPRADAHRKALLAASGAMSGNRPRSGSAPTQPNDAKSWALKAATKSHRDSPASHPFASGDPGFEAARIQNLAKNNVNRQLYSSAPPVAIEVEEKNRQDMLRASAVAMAQKMYAIQQTHIDEAANGARGDSRAAATSSHRRNVSDLSNSEADLTGTTPRYENLEEAARRLAQERLAKLHDEHAEYRSYYGASSPPARSRLSTRLRRRASTGAEDSSDEEQSRRIRKQMSLFTSSVAEVDRNKRQADRDKLLEVAHKNVEARMNKMDEKIFHDTGKASPAQRELWERQARERAQKQVDLSMQNIGKVHIGGGQYLEQSEVDAIAKARLQPTLDEINETADKQRARDEEIRLEQKRVADEAARDKARDAEVKADLKAAQARDKAEQKAKRDEERRVQKEHDTADKELKKAEVAAEKEKARNEKEEKRKSRDGKPGRFASILRRKSVHQTPAPLADTSVEVIAPTSTTATTSPGGAAAEGSTIHDQVTVPAESSEQRQSFEARPRYEETPSEALATDDFATSGNKRDSRVKSWLKTHLRGPSKTQKEETSTTKVNDLDQTRADSIRDVAMVGRTSDAREVPSSSAVEPVVARGDRDRSTSISSLSSSDAGVVETATSGATAQTNPEAGDSHTGLKNKLLGKFRSSKEHEDGNKLKKSGTSEDEFEEARDTFEQKLSPPSNLATERPRSSHEGSKFKEEL